MKALKWLVIVLACSCPPCLWSACEQPTTCDRRAWDKCVQFMAAVDEELTDCREGANLTYDEWNEQRTNWIGMFERCTALVDDEICPSLDVYDECLNDSIGCDLENRQVVVWGACLEIIGM